MATDSLILMDDGVDPLWRGHLDPPAGAAGAAGAGIRCVDLHEMALPGDLPHRWNLVGWIGRFRRRQFDRVHHYLPGRRGWPILAAAAWCRLPIHVHCTERLDPDALGRLRRGQRRLGGFTCAAEGIARQLRAAGIPRSKIQVTTPVVNQSDRVVSPDDTWPPLPERRPDTILFLALDPPGRPLSLHLVAWAAAICWHVTPRLRLVIAGRGDRRQSRRIEQWKQMFHAPDLIHLDMRPDHWPQWLDACDAVVAGRDSADAVLRLGYARAAGKWIIAGSDLAGELPADYPRFRQVEHLRPRQLAARLLEFCQSRLAERRESDRP